MTADSKETAQRNARYLREWAETIRAESEYDFPNIDYDTLQYRLDVAADLLDQLTETD